MNIVSLHAKVVAYASASKHWKCDTGQSDDAQTDSTMNRTTVAQESCKVEDDRKERIDN